MVAYGFGISPAAMRDVTIAEYRHMVTILDEVAEAVKWAGRG
jgi:hypothetical protein